MARPFVLFLALAAVACGEDGKGIGAGDHCPEQALYRYVYVDAGSAGNSGFWATRKFDTDPSGKPVKFSNLETEVNAPLKEATRLADPHANPPTSNGPRCLTPFGTAVTLDGG